MNFDINVELGERSYPLQIGYGNLDLIGRECAAAGLTGPCLLVTDEHVAPLYLDRVVKSLGTMNIFPALEIFPAGESIKSQESLFKLYNIAAEYGIDRNGFLIALGGGVIGDLTGYAAASWLRGIRFIQVPTTLLAMVDSSVGGKTGINIPAGKNLVGAFHQPEFVLMDVCTLNSLPPREFAAGMAEVVKYGIIRDAGLFADLEAGVAHADLGKIIARCCEIKADIVRQDEREGGLRGILNFGHTLAHAIENVAGYGAVLHGEAVAIGMVYAARLAAALNGFSAADAERIEKLLASLSLPVKTPELRWPKVRGVMRADKKSVNGSPRFVLPDKIGHVDFGCEVPDELLKEVWYGIRE
ncbi:MAG: 3-dehydroquinate synthase [Kiritimatiellales bacterium]